MSKSGIIGILLLICIFAAAAGCMGAKTVAKPTLAVPNTTASQNTFAGLPKAELNASETSDILLLQEEEKFESDLNMALYGLHNDLPVFLNISTTAQALMNADNVILTRYGLPNPESGTPGVFTNQALQQMYTTDINSGLSSATDALKYSMQFEDMHIADLTAAIGRTDNADVAFFYRVELANSRNNMRALAQYLNGYGAVYVPQYITPASYAQIIGSPMEQIPEQ